MGSKAFYKSKTFWSGIFSILTGVMIVAQTGHVGADAVAAILAGAGAIFGRANASAPLGFADAPAAAHREVALAKQTAAKAGKGWDPFNGQ